MSRSFTVPDLFDNHSRPPVKAKIEARRCDTHTFVEEQTTDEYGQATFSSLPEEIDVAFSALWGGHVGYGKDRWFFSHIVSVSEGGTGAGTAEGARENLGIDEAAMLWAIVL
jgi:hypothetical protein